MFDRQDLRNDIVAPLKAQESAINASQDLLKQVATIFGKQKQFILDSEMLTNMAPPETLPMVRQGYDPAVGLSCELGMLLLSINTLESKTVTELLNERGPLKGILSLVPPEMIEATLSRTEIEQHDEKTGVMRLQSEEGTTQTIEMVHYLDRWVPKDLADNWLANKEGIESKISSNLEQWEETAPAKQSILMVTQGITFLDQAITPLSASITEQEFDQALKNLTVLVGTPSDWLMMAFNSGNVKAQGWDGDDPTDRKFNFTPSKRKIPCHVLTLVGEVGVYLSTKGTSMSAKHASSASLLHNVPCRRMSVMIRSSTGTCRDPAPLNESTP